MWEDRVLYWAWRGNSPCPETTPTKKKLSYTKIIYDFTSFSICSAVYDDEKVTHLNKEEVNWHRNNGAVIEEF